MQLISDAYANLAPNEWAKNSDLMQAVHATILKLDQGELRVAKKINNSWQVETWIKQAILIYLKTQTRQPIKCGELLAIDKIPLKYNQDNLLHAKCRIVPPANIRFGAFLGADTIVMPAFINIGAYVGANTMIDTWATVGSCAQIGDNVHISGGVGIGGVLEPLQAQPTIIEDNCFIGARSEIVEGVRIGQGAVIGMGVMLAQSTKIYDRINKCFYKGYVPENAVVVPGTVPSECGNCHLAAAIIVKYVDTKTLSKTELNCLLR